MMAYYEFFPTFGISGRLERSTAGSRYRTCRLIKREKALLPVAVRRSKTPLNFVCGNKSITHSVNLNFPGETDFFFCNFSV